MGPTVLQLYQYRCSGETTSIYKYKASPITLTTYAYSLASLLLKFNPIPFKTRLPILRSLQKLLSNPRILKLPHKFHNVSIPRLRHDVPFPLIPHNTSMIQGAHERGPDRCVMVLEEDIEQVHQVERAAGADVLG